MTTKQVDKQGRLVLGARYANQTMIIDDSDETRIVITPAKVVPAHEAWLYNNPEAMQSVLVGLQQCVTAKLPTDCRTSTLTGLTS